MTDRVLDLARVPAHLGLGAAVLPQGPFTGEMSRYERYGARVADDGAAGRLMSPP